MEVLAIGLMCSALLMVVVAIYVSISHARAGRALEREIRAFQHQEDMRRGYGRAQ